MTTGDYTPNMSIYKPASSEELYGTAFASGLDKVDVHDHTGAPDKGVQIPTDGLVDGCVTPPKMSKQYIDKIIGDEGSGIIPDANDDVTITGDVVANGTHAKAVYHDDTLASASTLDVQLTKAVSTGAKAVTDVGLASFDSAAFAVDASTGHVTLAGSAGFPWTVVTGTTQALSVNNGYIGNNGTGITHTLPDTAAVGSCIRITNIGAGLATIAQNAGESINFVTSTTTVGVGGSLVATDQFSSIYIVCVVADSTWNVLSSTGNWTVT